MAETPSEQLAWEARVGWFAAAAAALAGLLFVAGGLYLGIALEQRPGGSNELLIQIRRESGKYIFAAVLAALASLLLGVVLAYLYRVTRHRRRELPRAAIVLVAFGALCAAVVALGRPLDLVAAAGEIPSAALRDERSTDELLGDRTSLQIIGGLGLAGNLALAFAMIFISLNAMRAGLLSRFLGVLGIVIGVLLPLVGAMPVLLFFWLGALAALFVGRWPGGRGPAWATGEAMPWPTMAQRNAELDRQKAARADDDDEAVAVTEADPDRLDNAEGEGTANGGPPAGQRTKRKRGRRG